MKALYLLLSLFFTTVLFAQQPGTLDETFGRNGQVWDTIGRQAYYPAMLVQSDDKIVVGGSGFLKGSGIKTFRIDRLLKDGKTDYSFGDSGKVLVAFHLSQNEENHEAFITAMSLQPDGKIVAAGTYRREHDLYGYLVVMRFMPNGNIDSSFGINGMVAPDVKGSSAATAMQLQPDGKIVIGGLNAIDVSGVFFMERLLPNGSLDSSFGRNGKVRNKQGSLHALAIQPDGKILAAGENSNFSGETRRILIRRYLINGTPDLSFGKNGAVDTLVGPTPMNFVNDIALQPDGKILCAGGLGEANGNLTYAMLVRFSEEGAIDKSFGEGGVAVSSYSASYTKILLSGNRIIAAGAIIPDTIANFEDVLVTAYKPNGATDSTFATNGILVSGNNYFDFTDAAALQSDGNILLLDRSQSYAAEVSVRNLFRYYGYAVQSSLSVEHEIPLFKQVASLLIIYPNPARDHVVINGLSVTHKTTIVISDASGKRLAVYASSGSSQYRCDVSKLTAGVYYLQVKTATTTEILKFIKQ